MSILSAGSPFYEILSGGFFKIATPQGPEHVEALRILGFTTLADQLSSDDARRHAEIQQYFPYCLEGEDAANFLAGTEKISRQPASDYDAGDIQADVASTLAATPERIALFDSVSLWRYQRTTTGGAHQESALIGTISTMGKDIEYVLARWGVAMPTITSLGDLRRQAEQDAKDKKQRVKDKSVVDMYEANRSAARRKALHEIARYWPAAGFTVGIAAVLVQTIVFALATIWVAVVAYSIGAAVMLTGSMAYTRSLSGALSPGGPSKEAYRLAKHALKK